MSSYGSIESAREPQTSGQGTLRFVDKFGFSLGHIFNDIGAGLWGAYTLLFLHDVQSMSNQKAGVMLMLGQVCGAFLTPVAGLLVDKVSTKIKWHIIGTVMTILVFPTFYSFCPFYGGSEGWWKSTYYIIMIILFQFSYCLVQVSHLAMIPDFSKSNRDRSDLTAMRQSATVISIIIVYAVSWVVFHSKSSGDDKISPRDIEIFRVSYT